MEEAEHAVVMLRGGVGLRSGGRGLSRPSRPDLLPTSGSLVLQLTKMSPPKIGPAGNLYDVASRGGARTSLFFQVNLTGCRALWARPKRGQALLREGS